MGKIIGIDFGTTKTIAAVLKDGAPVVIADRRGRKSIPSLVLLTPETEKSLFVGWEAKEHSKRYELDHLTISSIKRSLGKGQKHLCGWLHEHPEAIAGLILARLKLEVERQLGEPLEEAVIAIPANYSINQRWAIRQAAQLAGLEVRRLINEATAAAFYYQTLHKQDKTLLIFDLGGGTLDVSVVEIGEGVCAVKATAGDGGLGGDDFDRVLSDYVTRAALAEAGDFDSLELFEQLVLREAITRAKIELSSSPFSRIYLPGFIRDGSRPPRDLDVTIERAEFEELSKELLKRAETVIQNAMRDAGVDGSKLDAVLIIGGGSRIPAVRELIRRTVKDPYVGLDPEVCVAQGAAVQAGILSGDKIDALLLDVTPRSLSIETLGGVATRLIPKNTTFPTRVSEVFSTAADNQMSIEVKVYEGEWPMAADNRLMGSVRLAGIPPMPRGLPQIEVTFTIDVDGILEVSAKDVGTGREVKSAFTSQSRLSAEEVAAGKRFTEQMVSRIAVQLSYEEEKERAERLKQKASAWKREVENLIEAHRQNLSHSQDSMLNYGLTLLSDFSERGTSEEELERVYLGLKQQIDIFTEDESKESPAAPEPDIQPSETPPEIPD